MSNGYVDIYLLPIRANAVDAYREHALSFGQVAREHGALSYREFRGDDPGEGFGAPAGLVMTTAVVEFASRQHRDEVMANVMDDPRVAGITGADTVADMSQMRYGGVQWPGTP